MSRFAPERPDVILADFVSTCSDITELSPLMRCCFAGKAADTPAGEKAIAFSDDLV